METRTMAIKRAIAALSEIVNPGNWEGSSPSPKTLLKANLTLTSLRMTLMEVDSDADAAVDRAFLCTRLLQLVRKYGEDASDPARAPTSWTQVERFARGLIGDGEWMVSQDQQPDLFHAG